MSETHHPTEPSTNTDQPDLTAETEAVQGAQAGAPKPLPLPDWTPLGNIRDYFAEQIRQDGFR